MSSKLVLKKKVIETSQSSQSNVEKTSMTVDDKKSDKKLIKKKTIKKDETSKIISNKNIEGEKIVGDDSNLSLSKQGLNESNNKMDQSVSNVDTESDYRNILSKYDVKNNFSRPVISIYERTLLIGKRATQIAYGAIPNIEVSPGMSIVAIAEEELRLRKLPLIIKRTIGDRIEYWRPADMILLD